MKKQQYNVTFGGIGGQGIIKASELLGWAAMYEGFPVKKSEVHGMSQRGGSVMTHLKIGDFNSPLVKKGSADILLSLEKNEAYKTLHYLKPSINGRKGGLCFINAPDPDFMDPQIRDYLKGQGIETHVFGADRLARDTGSGQSTNIALIGFAAAHPGFPFSHDRLKTAIERVTSTKFRETSLKIFTKAYSEGKTSIKP